MLDPKPERPRKVSRKEATAVYRAVFLRDRGCVARFFQGIDECAGRLERDHVPRVSRKGVRETTSIGTVVLLCRHHHHGGWATSHRPWLREYLLRQQELGDSDGA